MEKPQSDLRECNGRRAIWLNEGQVVRDNSIGVTGSGTLGPTSMELANLIYQNSIGSQFSGVIQFNRFDRNTVGVRAMGNSQITHNQFADNDSTGVLVNNTTDVQISQNSFYAATGDNIRVENLAKEVEVRGNSMWVDQGQISLSQITREVDSSATSTSSTKPVPVHSFIGCVTSRMFWTGKWTSMSMTFIRLARPLSTRRFDSCVCKHGTRRLSTLGLIGSLESTSPGVDGLM